MFAATSMLRRTGRICWAACRWNHSLVRKTAPPFATKALVNGEFRQVKSDELRGKYWVLFFYPLDLYEALRPWCC